MDAIYRNPQGKSAMFEAREPSPKAYKGAERRRLHRRARGDRRVETRFELDKTDRRSCAGRRADDQRPNFW